MRRDRERRERLDHGIRVFEQRNAVAGIDARADPFAAHLAQKFDEFRREVVLVVFDGEPNAVLLQHRFGERERTRSALLEGAKFRRRLQRLVAPRAEYRRPRDRRTRRANGLHLGLKARQVRFVLRHAQLALKKHTQRLSPRADA